MIYQRLKKLAAISILFGVNAVAQTNTLAAPSAEAISQTTVQQKSKSSGFGVTYFLIGGQTLIKNNTELSSLDIFDSYLSFNYKVNRDLKFAVRPAFGYSVQGLDNKAREVTDKSRVRDLSFLVTFTNVAAESLPAEMNYKIQPRLYLPTSDGSQDQGMIARLRLENEINWELDGDWSLRAYILPSYFFQRYTAVPDASKDGRAKTTSMLDSEHGLEIGYTINKTFAILPCLHFVDKWSNTSPVNKQDQYHSSVLDHRLGLEVKATRDFGFVFGLQAERDLLDSKKNVEYSYSVLTGGTLF